MPFFVDDVFLRMLGISIPPFDMIWLAETIRDFAIKEAYDPEKIKDEMRENQLLYELGEISKEDYECRQMDLIEKMKLALRAREMDLERRVNLLGL
jgi:hypothetical protein